MEKQPEVIVITGASAGIGRATARRFARDGARVGLLARGREGLEGARQDVEALGGEALPRPTDVSSPEQLEAAVSMIEERFSPIDIWINNAMVSVFSPVKEMQPEEYRRVTEVTYLGYVYCTLSALKPMLPAIIKNLSKSLSAQVVTRREPLSRRGQPEKQLDEISSSCFFRCQLPQSIYPPNLLPPIQLLSSVHTL